MKTIFAINGSASSQSANKLLIEYLIRETGNSFIWQVFKDLKSLPHFDPDLAVNNPPESVADFRKQIAQADCVLICSPEYVFSIPSGLKNAIEWCVATTVFQHKPLGLITASAHGTKGHEELQLIMNTLMATLSAETTLLINGVKGKVDNAGRLLDPELMQDLERFAEGLKSLCADGSPEVW